MSEKQRVRCVFASKILRVSVYEMRKVLATISSGCERHARVWLTPRLIKIVLLVAVSGLLQDHSLGAIAFGFRIAARNGFERARLQPWGMPLGRKPFPRGLKAEDIHQDLPTARSKAEDGRGRGRPHDSRSGDRRCSLKFSSTWVGRRPMEARLKACPFKAESSRNVKSDCPDHSLVDCLPLSSFDWDHCFSRCAIT